MAKANKGKRNKPFVELRIDEPSYQSKDSGILRCQDEVVVGSVDLVHVERMSDTNYWMGLDLTDGRHVRVLFWCKKGIMYCGAEVEEAE